MRWDLRKNLFGFNEENIWSEIKYVDVKGDFRLNLLALKTKFKEIYLAEWFKQNYFGLALILLSYKYFFQWRILANTACHFPSTSDSHAAPAVLAEKAAACPCLYSSNCLLRLLNQSTKHQKLKIYFFNCFSCWEGNFWANIFAK